MVHMLQGIGGGKRVEDQFGGDPQVQYLRRVFAEMERKQRELLGQAGISPTDYRLRRIREATLKGFEKAWRLAMTKGWGERQEDLGDLYVCCLAKFLSGNRIAVPPEALPVNRKVNDVVNEVFR